MNSDTDYINIQIIASKSFSDELQTENALEVKSIKTLEGMNMPLVLGEVFTILAIVETVLSIFDFIIKYYEKYKKDEPIIVTVEDGEQVVISNIKEAKHFRNKLLEK